MLYKDNCSSRRLPCHGKHENDENKKPGQLLIPPVQIHRKTGEVLLKSSNEKEEIQQPVFRNTNTVSQKVLMV
ncbi:MAG: hypothetical protein AAFV95_27520 [Bacteroidota bacterium]